MSDTEETEIVVPPLPPPLPPLVKSVDSDQGQTTLEWEGVKLTDNSDGSKGLETVVYQQTSIEATQTIETPDCEITITVRYPTSADDDDTERRLKMRNASTAVTVGIHAILGSTPWTFKPPAN